MKSLTETLLGSALAFMLTGALVEFSVATLWATDKTFSADTLTRSGRAGLDEVLFQTRGASAILPTASANNTTYNTSSNTLILSAPSYDASATDFRITGQSDTIIFRYDVATKTLKETIVPGAGSNRPTRANFVIAQNVGSFGVKYKIRDTFTAPASGSTATYTLTQTPANGSPLTVLVDGAPAAATVSGTTLTLTGTAPATGASVQANYETLSNTTGVNPAASAVGVTITMNMATPGGKQMTTQFYSVEGSARLRNLRN